MARKRGMQYIPYDYEAAYNKAMEDMHEWFIENLFQHRKKVIYALKEITAGDQFEIEIYPQFRSMDEVPPEGRTIKKDNNKAQKNLNDKNARKYVERLINENFSDRDIWMTLTYDDEHLPPDGDVDAAIKNVQKYIRRINYQRKKRGLPNAKYVYVTAYNPDAEIRWHHHIVMDGALDMETVESCWKQSSRNEVRRLQTDENGLSGMANYIVEEKNRVPSEKRWNSSQGLRDPRIKVVHSKRPAAGGSYKKIGSFVDKMVKDRDSIPEILKKWYPDMDFTNAKVYYNDFNCMIDYNDIQAIVINVLALLIQIFFFAYGFVNAIRGMLSPKRMGAVIVAFFAATCITGTGNMVINSNVQIVLWWIVLIIPNIVGAVATFAYFVSGKKSKKYSIMIYLVTIWGMFRIIYSNYNLIVHANQYLSMNSTVRLVLEIAIHCLVIYQTYVLWIKRQNAIDIS